MEKGIPVLGISTSVTDDSLVVILILHIWDIIVLDIVLLRVPRVVHSADLLRLEGLGASQPARPQPPVIIVARALASEVLAVVNECLLVSRVPRKVVVETAVTGDVTGDEELLAGGQVADAAGLGVGVGPGPGGELVDEVVAGGEELFWGDLAGLTEGGGMGDGRVAVAEGVDGRLDVVHGQGVR